MVLVQGYYETNELSGHARSCAYGAGGDCTCGQFEDYHEELTPEEIQADAIEQFVICARNVLLEMVPCTKEHQCCCNECIPF